MDKKYDARQLEVQLEQVKRHRAWISGYEAGSGKRVPFGDNVRLLVMEVEHVLAHIAKATK